MDSHLDNVIYEKTRMDRMKINMSRQRDRTLDAGVETLPEASVSTASTIVSGLKKDKQSTHTHTHKHIAQTSRHMVTRQQPLLVSQQ